MPKLLARPNPPVDVPPPIIQDGLLVNGHDPLAERRAAHRAMQRQLQEAERRGAVRKQAREKERHAAQISERLARSVGSTAPALDAQGIMDIMSPRDHDHLATALASLDAIVDGERPGS